MSEHDVTVKFGASIGELISGVDAVKESIEGLTAPIRGTIAAFTGIGEAIATAFAVEKIGEFFSHFAESGAKTLKFAQLLGTSTESIGALELAAKGSDTSLQFLVQSMERLGTALARAEGGSEQAKAGLKALGIEAKEFQGLSPDKKIEELAEKFAVLKDGIDKDAIAMAIMGRAGAEMIPFLNRGAEGTHEFTAMAERAGSAMSREVAQGFEATHIKLIEAGAAFTGLGIAISSGLKPAFDNIVTYLVRSVEGLTRWITESHVAKVVGDVLAVAVKSIAEAFVTAYGAGQIFWELGKLIATQLSYDFIALGKIIAGVFTFDKSAITAAWAELMNRNHQLSVDGGARLREVINGVKDSIVSTWQVEAGQEAEIHQTKTARLELEDKKAVRSALAAANEKIRIADLEYAQTAERLNSEAKIHAITEQQKTQALLAALDVRHGKEIAAIGEEFAIAKRGTAEYQAVLNEKLTLEQKFQNDRAKIINQGLEAEVKEWNTALSQLQGAWDSQLKGLLSGTTSWGQAMKNIFRDLAIKAVEGMETMAVKWAAMELAKTGATTAGEAARKVAEQAGGLANIGAQVAGSISVITADAAKTFAGVFAFLSPEMGPAAAGPAVAAGATVLGAIGGIPSAAVGGFVLQSGLANVHAGETITPAAMAQPYDPGSGGGGPPTVNINFTHNGSLSYADIQAHARTIAQAVSQQFANNPSYA